MTVTRETHAIHGAPVADAAAVAVAFRLAALTHAGVGLDDVRRIHGCVGDYGEEVCCGFPHLFRSLGPDAGPVGNVGAREAAIDTDAVALEDLDGDLRAGSEVSHLRRPVWSVLPRFGQHQVQLSIFVGNLLVSSGWLRFWKHSAFHPSSVKVL